MTEGVDGQELIRAFLAASPFADVRARGPRAASRPCHAGAAPCETASLTVDFLRAAEGQDLIATAKVVRRGRSLCHCTVEASDAAGPVATGIVVYALS